MSEDVRRIIHGFVANWIQLIGRSVLTFVELGILYRYCPAEVVGTWLIFLSAGVLINLTDLGLGPTLSRFVAYQAPADTLPGRPAQAEGYQARIRSLMSCTYALGGVLALGLIGVALLIEPLVARRFAGTMDPRLFRASMVLFFGGVALNAVGSVPLRVLNGTGKVAQEQYLRLGLTFARVAMEVSAVLVGWGLLGLAAANLLSGLLCWLVSSVSLFHSLPGLQLTQGRASWRMLREMVGPSARWLLMTIGALMVLNSANPLIGWFLGPAAVPDYAALYQLVVLGTGLIGAVPNSFVPFIAREYAHNNWELISLYHRLAVKLAVALAGLFVFTLWHWAEDILRLWLGPGHFVGRLVLGLLLVLAFLECHHVANATCTMALNRIPFGPWALGSGLLNLILASLFIQRWGLVGVAAAAVLSQLLTNNWFAVYYTLRTFGTPLNTYWRSVVLPGTAILLPVAFLSFGLRHLLGSSLWGLVLGWVVMLAAFVTWSSVILSRNDRLIQAQLPMLGRFGILS
jgi:O-antigen/teichoic acid export membrane protein